MKTLFEEIIDVASIGLPKNPIVLNKLLQKASAEQIRPTARDKRRSLLLCIDLQNSFMENGSLAVPNSHKDIENLTRWVYENMEDISKIAFSLDTHIPFQIFHPCWWVDGEGNHPAPYTVITLDDLDNGKWFSPIKPDVSRTYVEQLERLGEFKLIIWPYHCLQGTFGHSLENQFSNIVNFHSVAKKSVAKQMVKGNNPESEMYGILKAEYESTNKVNIDLLNDFSKYDLIVIAGEAKSHCVRRSIEQILDHFKDDRTTTEKIVILEDCMSSIPSFEDATDLAFKEFKNQFGVNLKKSTEFKIKDMI